MKSLDAVFSEPIDPEYNLDAIEGKLFGIGAESYTVGSHEFYLAYALKHGKLLCLDAGHYHPTEQLGDKLSSVLCFLPEVLLHVSRGVRWDSDHVVTLGDDLLQTAREVVANGYESRVHVGLDFFDASINRVAAWAIGTRNMLKSLLVGLLEPTAMLQRFEADRDYTSRLALQEEAKLLPYGAVWDYHCLKQNVPRRRGVAGAAQGVREGRPGRAGLNGGTRAKLSEYGPTCLCLEPSAPCHAEAVLVIND